MDQDFLVVSKIFGDVDFVLVTHVDMDAHHQHGLEQRD